MYVYCHCVLLLYVGGPDSQRRSIKYIGLSQHWSLMSTMPSHFVSGKFSFGLDPWYVNSASIALLMVVAYFARYYRMYFFFFGIDVRWDFLVPGILAFWMPKCDFYFNKRSTVIIEGGTFIQINVVSRDSKSLSPRFRDLTVVDVPCYSCRFERCRNEAVFVLQRLWENRDIQWCFCTEKCWAHL